MSKYTIRRSDAEEKDRTWQGGNYAVRNEKGTVALFMFDYPECRSPVCANNEAEALAAAKSFMAIDDLVAALFLIDPTGKFDGWESGCGELIGPTIAAALEKAGIK